jgi:hypothetical protein
MINLLDARIGMDDIGSPLEDRMPFLSLLFAAVAAPAEAAPIPPDFTQLWTFATFTAAPAFEPTAIRVKLGTFQAGEGVYWIVRDRVNREKEHSGPVEFTNSTLCPKVLPQLRRLEDLDMPAPDVPGMGRDADIIIMDGVSYTLQGSSRHADGQPGDYSIESNVGSPLARWVDGMDAALEGCWRPLPKH